MFLYQRMGKENMVHLHYSAIKIKQIMKFVGNWVEIGMIILSEVTHGQKDTYAMYSLISGY